MRAQPGRKDRPGPESGRQDPDRRRGLTIGSVFLVLIFLAATGVFMLVMRQCAVRADLKMRKVESRIADEKCKQETLRLTLARLKSPGRVARIATDELGLSEPSGVIYLKYSRDAAGNIVTQSTFEELAPSAVQAKEEDGTQVAKDGKPDEGAAEQTGEETSGTGW